MASVRKEVSIDVPPEHAWSAMRDVGALHTRLVAGFVTDCRLEGDARIVTFANGVVARELIVDVDHAQRRVAWAAVGGRLTHHNASFTVVSEGARTRLVWVADLLPNELAPVIEGMMDLGTGAIRRAFAAAAPDAAMRAAICRMAR